MMALCQLIALIGYLCLQQCVAFVITSTVQQHGTTSTRLYARPPELLASSSLLPEKYLIPEYSFAAHSNIHETSSLLLSLDLVEVSKTVGLVIVGVGIFFTLLTYVTVNVLMPAAAKQVEELTKENDPELWNEYMRKLGPGETMATRPDLVQELGQKMVQLQSQQLQRAEERAKASERGEPEVLVDNDGSKMTTRSSSKVSSNNQPLDVEIVDRNQWDD
ncbi:hypothetical protein MPSEU_000629500 [Mayamaea pseudoterrestris]|nr:hypothetical protein MPSEU_000629500 [Mayamaea pseudoterrestris]